jgi:hypothetical protein
MSWQRTRRVLGVRVIHVWVAQRLVRILPLSLLALLSCERPDFFGHSYQPAVGYQINGRVVDRFGVPMVGVEIYPYYDLVYESSDEAPSREYEVKDSIAYVTFRVLDARDSVTRDLGAGWFAPGPILVDWDRKDESGADPPSGLYRVCYIVEGRIVGSYPVLVEGTLSARTDSSGCFTLSNRHLPMGFSPVPLFSQDSTVYYGIYCVGSTVVLELVAPSRIHPVAVRPAKDRVTNVPLVLD